MPNYLPRPLAIAILIIAATLFAANHVSARFAFDDGAGLVLALIARSSVAFLIMLVLAMVRRQSLRIPVDKRRWQLFLGGFITLQSLTLYAAVARIPVAIALLIINSWPLLYTLLNWMLKGQRPSRLFLSVLIIILIGLVLVLDIPVWLANPATLGEDWAFGVFLAAAASVFLALAMWLTNNQLAQLPGSVRSAYTMFIVSVSLAVSGGAGLIAGGFDLPQHSQGWLGIVSLALCYGIASTILFVLVPRLNIALNAPILNFEPVASLVLSYLILGQVLSFMQLLGGAVVLGGIMLLSLSKT